MGIATFTCTSVFPGRGVAVSPSSRPGCSLSIARLLITVSLSDSKKDLQRMIELYRQGAKVGLKINMKEIIVVFSERPEGQQKATGNGTVEGAK